MRVLQEDRQAFWKKWISGKRHGVYLELMTEPDNVRSWRAGDLRTKAAAFRELRSWLNTLDTEQKISLQDILEHFEYTLPPTDFVILCRIADESLKKGKQT